MSFFPAFILWEDKGIATSLDGFIAQENGDIDWLGGLGGGDESSGEDYGYQAFISVVTFYWGSERGTFGSL